MALSAMNTEQDAVKSVRICIGKDWVEHRFGNHVPRGEAMKRARQILESLA